MTENWFAVSIQCRGNLISLKLRNTIESVVEKAVEEIIKLYPDYAENEKKSLLERVLWDVFRFDTADYTIRIFLIDKD